MAQLNQLCMAISYYIYTVVYISSHSGDEYVSVLASVLNISLLLFS
jgi:hypothetical protein